MNMSIMMNLDGGNLYRYYSGWHVNEKVEKLARRETSISFVGPESLSGINDSGNGINSLAEISVLRRVLRNP